MKQFNGFTSSTPEFQFRHSTNTFWKCAHPFLRQKIRSVFELSRKAPTPYNLFQWNVTYIKIVFAFPEAVIPWKSPWAESKCPQLRQIWLRFAVEQNALKIDLKNTENWFEKHSKLIWKTLKTDLTFPPFSVLQKVCEEGIWTALGWGGEQLQNIWTKAKYLFRIA